MNLKLILLEKTSKRKKGTKTACMEVQSYLSRALDEGKFALMASIDLSSAFDLVNVKLLLKRCAIIGLPKDIVEMVEMVEIWLKERMYYVHVKISYGEFGDMYECRNKS